MSFLAKFNGNAALAPVPETKAPAVRSFAGGAAVAALARRTVEERYPAAEVARAREVFSFLSEVARLRRELGLSVLGAIAELHQRLDTAELFPLLETDKLTYHNWRLWDKQCGRAVDGAPLAAGLEALIRDYRACGCQDAVMQVFRSFNSGVSKENSHALVAALMEAGGIKVGCQEFWEAFFNNFLSGGGQVAMAHRYAEQSCRNRGVPGGVPNVRAVRRWCSHYLPKEIEVIARDGEKGVREQVISYARRDYSALAVGELLVGDHHVFDCLVRVEDGNGGWKAERPWLTQWIDAKSWYPAGWFISCDDPDHESVIDAFGLAVATMGNTLPRVIYHDNGKDFCKMGFSDAVKIGDGHCILKQLGVKSVRSIPYRAQAKIVERFFGEVAKQFSRTWGSWLGSDTVEGEKRLAERMHFLAHPEELPNMAEFMAAYAVWLEQNYITRPQDGKILQGDTPAGAWARRQPMGPSWETDRLRMAFLMPLPQTRTVDRGYCVRVGGSYYRNYEGLKGWLQRQVMIKKCRLNGDLFAFDLEGRLLCPLEPVPEIPVLAETDAERQMIADEERLKRHIGKNAYTWARGLTGTNEIVPIQEHLKLTMGDHELVKLSTTRSVKGRCHEYTGLRAVPAAELEAQAKEAAARIPEVVPEPKIDQAEADARVAAAERLRNLRKQQKRNSEF